VIAAHRLRQDYVPGYSPVGLDEAVNRARYTFARKRTVARNMRLAALLVLLGLVVAGGLIRVPVPGVSALTAEMPSEIATVNLWERALLGFVGWTPETNGRWKEPLDFVQQAYEQYVAGILASKLTTMELPEDIASDIACWLDEMASWPDSLRVKGMVGDRRHTSPENNAMWVTARFGWKPIRSQLSSIGGLPLDSDVKPVVELTERERALLAPSYDMQLYLGARSAPGSGVRTYGLAGSLAQSEKSTWSARDYVTCNLGAEGYVALMEAKRAFSKFEADRWLAKNFLVQVASPVTGRVFDPNHREFSRGNGYIQKITDRDQLQAIQKAVRDANLLQGFEELVQAPPGYDWPGLEDVNWFYIRIYGETEVIAEGVWAYDEHGYPSPALSSPFYIEKARAQAEGRRITDQQSAPDYEEWLATLSHDELVTIAASRWGWAEALATPRDLELNESDASLNKLRRGNVQGLRGDTIAGLPLNDPLPTIESVPWNERILIASALTGDTSALEWFRRQDLAKLTRHEWMKRVLSAEKLRELLPKWWNLGTTKARVLLLDLPRAYNTGADDLPFLPIYRDFEPYQGYFERITDTDALVQIEDAAGHHITDAIYFRLYGENRVIAEGVRAY